MIADIPRDIPAEIQELTNEYREENGLPLLVLDLELTRAAQKRIESIVVTKNFSHDKFDSVIPQTRYAYGRPSVLVGENLSCGKTVENAFKSWLRSSAHRKNIEETRFRSMGVAVITANLGRKKCHKETDVIIVEMFGSA